MMIGKSFYLVLTVVSLLLFLELPSSVCAGGMCADVPSGGGQSIGATVTKPQSGQTPACPVTDGMYVRTYTVLRLDSVATAEGQCQIMNPSCTVAGCVCVPGQLQERTINHIYVPTDVASETFNGSYNAGNIFGKNPNGTTAFWHLLDSTQPNSTGPISFATQSAGSYALHFQANINTTNCNILPSVTPIANITLYARTTLHRGQRSSGSLVGGWNLPNSGTGYYHDPVGDPAETDDWGGKESTGRLIEIVGAQWTPNPRFGYLDVSRQLGGQFLPHDEHQNGLDIDLRYVRNNGTEGPLDFDNPTQASLYSRDLTIQLLNLFATNGTLDKIIVSPNAGISSADVPGVNVVIDNGTPTKAREHQNHIHISLVDPDGPDSNNCP
jgi:hypothetical protein